ncbi:MAG: peptidoglycan-associated lipoprotein Pal [Deltaproteobacteria bacterium]|nr:peptidoglycan-associated lipoprotein Pal [Deltaproteobacteria bacterium]
MVVALSSCSKKDVKQDEPLISPTEGKTDQGTAVTGGEEVTSASSGELQTIYFEFDRYTIRPDAREALRANASWLKKNPTANVQMEGHCDERGTNEYNLALGEKRAASARDYLAKLGISRNRLSVISYGEERPADPGHDETAWAKNRRAAFVIVSR